MLAAVNSLGIVNQPNGLIDASLNSELLTVGSSLVDANWNFLLQDLTVAGNMQFQDNMDSGFIVTINNIGSIANNNSGNAADIEIQAGGATLMGVERLPFKGPPASVE